MSARRPPWEQPEQVRPAYLVPIGGYRQRLAPINTTNAVPVHSRAGRALANNATERTPRPAIPVLDNPTDLHAQGRRGPLPRLDRNFTLNFYFQTWHARRRAAHRWNHASVTGRVDGQQDCVVTRSVNGPVRLDNLHHLARWAGGSTSRTAQSPRPARHSGPSGSLADCRACGSAAGRRRPAPGATGCFCRRRQWPHGKYFGPTSSAAHQGSDAAQRPRPPVPGARRISGLPCCIASPTYAPRAIGSQGLRCNDGEKKATHRRTQLRLRRLIQIKKCLTFECLPRPLARRLPFAAHPWGHSAAGARDGRSSCAA